MSSKYNFIWFMTAEKKIANKLLTIEITQETPLEKYLLFFPYLLIIAYYLWYTRIIGF